MQTFIREEELKNCIVTACFSKYDCTRIVLLDSPLPPCIKIAMLLPQDYRLHVGEGRKLPLVRISREKNCNIHDIIYLVPTDRHQRMCCLEYSTNALRYRYMRPSWGMDSGHPLFLLFGSELAFVCPARGFYSDNQATGFFCTFFLSQIQQAMDDLSDTTGSPRSILDYFDLSQFTTHDKEYEP